MKKTKILKIKGDWNEVVDDCRATVGKSSLGKEPSKNFKRKILMAEHSPIRDLIVKWLWEAMPHWVGVHWVRHKWECYVRTQRSDRTGIDRTKLPQDEPQNFTGEANVQHTIDTWRKRMCYMASYETREYANDFKRELHPYEPEWSDSLVPNCVYRGGCPEMESCGWYAARLARDPKIGSHDLFERYEAYNKFFWRDDKEVTNEKE